MSNQNAEKCPMDKNKSLMDSYLPVKGDRDYNRDIMGGYWYDET